MEYFYIIGICIIIILILTLVIRSQIQKRYQKEYKDKYEELLNNKSEELRADAKRQIHEDLAQAQKVHSATLLAEQKLHTLIKSIEEKTTFNKNLQLIREEELDRLIEEKRKARLQQLDTEIEEWSESAQESATWQFNNIMSKYQKELDEKSTELRELSAEVNEYRDKRRAINEEILRSRAINEQQDFYRIQLDNDSKNDMELINSIRPRLRKFATLNKLIYDNYISKPAKEMVKRVLSGKDPSGIYKVTNIETHEIYIGKSTTVASRWINHIKSAEGLEGVADSQFQRALRDYGIENFTWELLEEVPKDKLTNKEKYWIEFYDSKKYGYNERLG